MRSPYEVAWWSHSLHGYFVLSWIACWRRVRYSALLPDTHISCSDSSSCIDCWCWLRSPFEHWSYLEFTFPAWVLRSFMNSSLMSNEITLIYTEIKIQYSKNIDLLIWMRWWKSYITMKKVLLRFLLPSSGKLSFWITEFLLTGSSGHHNGWAGGQEVGLLHQIPG